VLVVDDSVDSAESLGLIVSLWGHEVRLAHDGPAAIEEARAFRPDLVLLDLGMPGMSGYDVARQLRDLADTRRAVLVAQTGWGQDDDRRTKEAGFDHHLVKPIDPQALEALLAAVAPVSGM
jgi:CheY-like chemotaxis protein